MFKTLTENCDVLGDRECDPSVLDAFIDSQIVKPKMTLSLNGMSPSKTNCACCLHGARRKRIVYQMRSLLDAVKSSCANTIYVAIRLFDMYSIDQQIPKMSLYDIEIRAMVAVLIALKCTEADIGVCVISQCRKSIISFMRIHA
jgi:hypothetical protein